jgi:hypothetical protein
MSVSDSKLLKDVKERILTIVSENLSLTDEIVQEHTLTFIVVKFHSCITSEVLIYFQAVFDCIRKYVIAALAIKMIIVVRFNLNNMKHKI